MTDLSFPPAPLITPLAFERGLRRGVFRIRAGQLEKRCSGCGAWWPTRWGYWRKEKRSGRAHPRCRTCYAEGRAR